MLVVTGALLTGTVQGQATPVVEVIRVGLQETAFPFAYRDRAGQPQGYAWEICQRALQILSDRSAKDGQRREIKPKVVSVTSSTRLAMLLAHEIDLECGSTTNTDKRSGLGVEFSPTIFVSGVTALVRREALDPLTRFDDVLRRAGRRDGGASPFIVTTEGSTSIRYLRDRVADRIIEVRYGQTHEESFALLVQNPDALAFVMDEALLRGRLAAAPAPLRAQWEVLKGTITASATEHYGIMFRKSDAAFGVAFQAAMQELFRSGEMERLYERWFMAPIPAYRTGRPGADEPATLVLALPLSDGLRQLFNTPSNAPFAARP